MHVALFNLSSLFLTMAAIILFLCPLSNPSVRCYLCFILFANYQRKNEDSPSLRPNQILCILTRTEASRQDRRENIKMETLSKPSIFHKVRPKQAERNSVYKDKLETQNMIFSSTRTFEHLPRNLLCIFCV